MEKRTILTEEQLNHVPKDVLIAMYVQLSETMNRVAEQNAQLLQQVSNLEEKIDILTQRYYGRKTEKASEIDGLQLSFDFDADKWYIMNIKHEQKGIYECSIYDEKYTELYNKTQNPGHEVTNQSDTLILGNDIDFASGGATLQIDLSETYFKNGDTIISEWNL